MLECQLHIHDQKGACLAKTEWSAFPILVYYGAYNPGDNIQLEVRSAGSFFEIQLEDSMQPAIVYLSGDTLRFDIPFDEQRAPYSPKAFTGKLHMITAKQADESVIYAHRNLALNPYDGTAIRHVYPHASANIETRGEAVFAARNTIDGIYANSFHGEYPYTSWGINRDPQAALKIDLGVPCLVDEVHLTLRADFPHDNYWTGATLDFSDGGSETVDLVRSPLPQSFYFSERKVQWVVLHELIQSDDPSPFPALTQIELWGTVFRNN